MVKVKIRRFYHYGEIADFQPRTARDDEMESSHAEKPRWKFGFESTSAYGALV